jgi:hypothetical protein
MNSESKEQNKYKKSVNYQMEDGEPDINRPYPKVSLEKETGLILYEHGYRRNQIGPKLKKSPHWFYNQCRNDAQFATYAKEIEIDLQSYIRGDVISIVNTMNNFLNKFSKVNEVKYSPKEMIDLLWFALEYLTRTGYLPKAKKEDAEEIEASVTKTFETFISRHYPKFDIY